jgi:suppressor for copper-sensitivity B
MRTHFLLSILFALGASAALALEGAPHASNALNARLISAQQGVAANAKTLSAGLDVELADGWKTYWRSPGEVGLPPEIDWSASENVASVALLYPSPTRFRAFGIENFGYSHSVLFPLQVTLEDAGQPAVLRGDFSLLVCAEVCIPDNFSLDLEFANVTGIDGPSAEKIAASMRLVPDEESAEVSIRALLTEDVLTVEAQSMAPFVAVDVFPEFGPGSAFGAPDIRISPDGLLLWAALPVLALDDEAQDLRVTLVDRDFALTVYPEISDVPLVPPYEGGDATDTGLQNTLWMLLIAFLGGLILNVMPCVLPVLSIKFASALKVRDQGTARIRRGFLASALGVLAFMWALAAALLVLRAFGQTVGWGLQFQSPIFLIVMIGVLLIFAANMIGLYEVSLPQGMMTRLDGTGPRSGYLADFSTGALAAVLSTPCSAPFLGTAVAFALAGSGFDVVSIFTALGLGLATPYLLVALRPSLVQALPAPGRWMLVVKVALGFLLLGTALWLSSVLATIAGLAVAVAVTLLFAAAVVLLAVPTLLRTSLRRVVLFLVLVAPLIMPVLLSQTPAEQNSGSKMQLAWSPFDRAQIPRLVSEGKIVFVDATADWCLTCQANKRLVLSKGEVAEILQSETVVPMIADWTRQDADIARFLRANNRFGVPFNIVYGPAAPEGIALPELLTSEIVLNALAQAGG